MSTKSASRQIHATFQNHHRSLKNQKPHLISIPILILHPDQTTPPHNRTPNAPTTATKVTPPNLYHNTNLSNTSITLYLPTQPQLPSWLFIIFQSPFIIPSSTFNTNEPRRYNPYHPQNLCYQSSLYPTQKQSKISR